MKLTIKTRIALSAVLFILGLVFGYGFFVAAYIIIGYDVVYGAIKGVIKGEFLDELFLMSIASIGAFLLGQYAEGTAVMLFYQIGEYFNDLAMDKSNRSIDALSSMVSDTATVIREGKAVAVDPNTVKKGEIIEVKVGERVPIDAIVTEGTSSLDTSSLTGESLLRPVEKGSILLSGMINTERLIKAKTTKVFEESTSNQILQMVIEARKKKSKSEEFITRFARIYTPIVVLIATALTAIPVLFFGLPFATWIYRSLLFLVVSCPCALVISVPLAYFGGIGAISRIGVLVKGSNYIDLLAKVNYMAFDKTGTITQGKFSLVGESLSEGYTLKEVLRYAALSESKSNHPIAQSLTKEYENLIKAEEHKQAYSIATDRESQNAIGEITEISGKGLSSLIDGKRVDVGNDTYMKELHIRLKPEETAQLQSTATLVHVAVEGNYIGTLGIGDRVKEKSKETIYQLKRLGIKRSYLISGDNQVTTDHIAGLVNINETRAGLLPIDKVKEVEAIKGQGRTVAFVGDGMNDAPVITVSDVGIAMGALGSDAAIQASDVVILGEDLSVIPQAIIKARKTKRIAQENIIIALTIKFAILGLGAIGLATMWMAVFADVGVTFIAVLNAMRLLKVDKKPVHQVKKQVKMKAAYQSETLS